MKTIEQIQTELKSYLTKTSQHVFADVDNNKYLRLVETKTVDGETIWFSIWLDENLEINSIDRTVNTDGVQDPNYKCVVKHSLFLNRNLKAVKLRKKTQSVADALITAVSGLSKPPMTWNERGVYMKSLIEKLKA